MKKKGQKFQSLDVQSKLRQPQKDQQLELQENAKIVQDVSTIFQVYSWPVCFHS